MSADEDDFLTELREVKAPPEVEEELDPPDVELWGRDFLTEYKSVGDRHSFENEHLHIGLCLALVSQAVGNAYFLIGDGKESTRVHPLIIQGSGTGKDPAFDFAKFVADEAGLSMRDVNDVTNAGFIGSPQKEEPEPGLVKDADIAGFREATNLFRTTNQDHSANFAENLNQVLDGKKVTRHQANGKLEYQPDCTLVGTTYPPTDLDLEEFMNNGLLARFLYFFKPVDDDYRWRIGERIIEESVKQSDEDERVDRLFRLAETIDAINRTFESEQKFGLHPEIQEFDVPTRMKSIYNEYEIDVQEIVKPAIARYTIQFLRVSCLMAALDECSTIVEKRHADMAWEIIEESWRNLLEFYDRTTGTDPEETNFQKSEIAILQAVMLNEGISQTELAEESDYSERTIRKVITPLKMKGLLRKETEGREKRYYPPKDDD